MIGALYASFFFIAGGIILVATFRGRKRAKIGTVLASAIILIGVTAAIDYFQPFPTFLAYAIIAVGIAILTASFFLMFDENHTSSMPDQSSPSVETECFTLIMTSYRRSHIHQ